MHARQSLLSKLIIHQSGNENLKIIISRKRIPLIIQIILSLTILFIGILILSPVKTVHCNPYTNIDVNTANNMITNGTYPNLTVLDVRSTSSYNEGHIEKAISIPVAQLDSKINQLLPYNDTEIIVYCQSGTMSTQASILLDSYGFTKVFNLSGGFDAWESAGFSVIPELSSWIMLSLFLIISMIVIIIRKRTGTKLIQ